MRRAGRPAIAVVLLAAAAASLPAQEGGCRMELVSVGGVGRRVVVPGGSHWFAGGGVRMRCIGQETTIQADSVAWFTERQRVEFLGAVRFRDSVTSLSAARATYFVDDERVEASGDVELVNRRTGSVLTGPNLTYWRAVPARRDTTEILARQRPTVRYRTAEDTAAAPWVIVGDRVRLRGQSQAWAAGRVTIDREDLTASGDSAALDTGRGEGYLVGAARAASRDSAGYTLTGRRIAFRLEENRLRWLQAQERAHATSAEWQVTGDTIEFHVADDRIQGGAAWGDATRPEAVSADQAITADSLAIDAPDQVLTELRGYGTARATAQTEAGDPEPDWMAGDTLIARFDSTAAGERALVMLGAVGNARALYHIYEDAAEGAAAPEPAINYARGRRITAYFTERKLDRVIMHAADGVYLEPARPRRP